MLTTMVLLNVACLALLLLALWRLRQVVTPQDSGEQFARLLAEATPVAASLMRREAVLEGRTRTPAPVNPGAGTQEAPGHARDHASAKGILGDAERVAGIGLVDRLGIIRRMLQGQRAEETAAVVGISVHDIRALYRLHGREKSQTG